MYAIALYENTRTYRRVTPFKESVGIRRRPCASVYREIMHTACAA